MVRALVIEDAADSRRMLELVMAQRGLETHAFADAEAGLAAHRAEPFDLMVVDWQLPGMNGLDFCRRVRALPGGDDLAILVVTGRGDPEDVDAVFQAGATDYLRKPLELGPLNIRLRVAERQVREAHRRREAERRLQTIAANLPGLVYQTFVHPDGRVEVSYLSDGLRDQLGLDPTASLPEGDEVWSYVHNAAGALADIADAARRLVPRVAEHRIARADGRETWLQTHARPTPLSDGRVRWDGVAVDITERKRAEEALRRSEASFRAIIEHSPEAILVHRNDQLLYANPTFVGLLGYERAEDVPSESVMKLYHPEDHDRVRRARSEIAKTGGPNPSLEMRLMRGDGEVVAAEAAGMRIDYDGAPAVLVMFRDVTERNEMRARLMAADRMASVGTLAAGVAHELNNPLAYVLSNTRLIREEIDDLKGELSPGRFRALAELADESAEGLERVRTIVRDLKTFARIDDEDHQEIVDLARLVDSCIGVCRNDIRHRARLEKVYEHTPPVRINEARLGQVVLNLLINAAQAIPEGRASQHRIDVRLATEQDGSALIEIRDTGAGIPRDNLERIFDPFFTTKGMGEGTGLGLSICRNIVSAAGGEVSVESTPGTGSVFRVRLPAAPSARSSRPAPRPSSHPPSASARKVLVIDDEPLVGRALKRVLRAHDVVLATSGREAIAILDGSPSGYDLILCDLMMPELSGMEVYGAVCQTRPELADRFVFMTGGAFTPAARQFLDQVGNDRIEKPFDPHRLRDLVQERT